MNEVNAILAIAYRDLAKFLRDRPRLITTLIVPLVFIGALGGGLQANLNMGYDFLVFVFTGVLAQTLFQSAAFGVISLIEDRTTDFSQEIFVSPISRYSIIAGKIAGESLVALAQGAVILLFGLLIKVPLSPARVLALLPVTIVICLLGGAFGIIVLSNLSSQRAANQIFPFVMLPQYFVAGIFAPIQALPLVLEVVSRLSPLRYAVDLLRGVFYAGRPEYARVVLESPLVNGAIIAALFAAFLVIGTWQFVRAEQNR